MNTQIKQLEKQNDLLQRIAMDTTDIEQIVGGSMAPDDRQRALLVKIGNIRRAALAGMSDREITVKILTGYREDCVNVLFTVKEQLDAYFSGRISLNDEQLQHMVMACEMYVRMTQKYFGKKAQSGVEVENG